MRAGSQVAGGGAGLRLLDFTNTHDCGGGDEESGGRLKAGSG